MEEFTQKGFVRISKGYVINLNHVDYIELEFNGSYILYTKNKDKLMISRNYVKSFKQFVEKGWKHEKNS